ncbi:unnamed protein product [Closterium sp. Yama58-4]|nr:unnamed protein product [Closterium sp. Yama58-4]
MADLRAQNAPPTSAETRVGGLTLPAMAELAQAAGFSSAQPPRTMCSQCQQEPAKYRCPGCSAATCSVPCVKAHKAASGCTGKRNRAEFVPITKFDDNQLVSGCHFSQRHDLRFLEDALLQYDVAKRTRTALGVRYEAQVGKHWGRMQQTAKQRGVQLLLMPPGMSKRKANRTYFQHRKRCIMWHVRWQFAIRSIRMDPNDNSHIDARASSRHISKAQDIGTCNAAQGITSDPPNTAVAAGSSGVNGTPADATSLGAVLQPPTTSSTSLSTFLLPHTIDSIISEDEPLIAAAEAALRQALKTPIGAAHPPAAGGGAAAAAATATTTTTTTTTGRSINSNGSNSTTGSSSTTGSNTSSLIAAIFASSSLFGRGLAATETAARNATLPVVQPFRLQGNFMGSRKNEESSAVAAASFVASSFRNGASANGVLTKSRESDGPVANGVTIANAVANVENAFNELKKTIVNVAADSIVSVEGKNKAEEVIQEKEKEAETMDEEEDYEEEEEEYEYPVVADEPDEIDARDANTPDKWISRHPSLVRLTGKHPFNCEPPLSRLLTSGLGSGSASDSGSAALPSRSDPASGFITPVPLHYVRNHGYVPRLDWSTWRIDISGLVSKPASLSMADLLAMPSRKLPVLLVCVGNRRKEQNAVKQTIGFSWGAGAAATTVWKGVLLRDVLIKCGVQLKGKNAGKFVCFEGAETLPGGGGSTYGTSMELWRVMDPANEVLLAYEQNGQVLSPDHGFPVRVIIPGFIGGRMVKWLKKVEVTREESQNYYHFHDNRVLPSHVDAETAMKDGWWRKKEYICNELAINSAIVSPDHGDVVALEGGAGRQVVTMKGYAYSGGGRRVTRVEITLDGGNTWRLCDITHPSPPTRHGKHWTWSLWATEVPVVDLVGVKEVAVRAWDDATNTQPDKLTWNVMGMMNNCWFRVRVAPTVTPAGSIGLQFIHPTRPGNLPGGWMYDMPGEGVGEGKVGASTAAGGSTAAVLKAADAPAAAGVASQAKQGGTPAPAASPAVAGSGARSSSSIRKITMAEIERHADESSPWIVVHGRVYDCTKFLKDHPGGSESITINAGTDVTEEFDAIHSEKAKKMLEEYYIGDLAGEGEEGTEMTASVAAAAPESAPPAAATPAPTPLPVSPTALHPTTLDPKKRIPVPLLSKVSLSPDVRRFRFALPSPNHILGLPVGKHLFVCAKVGGKLVMRAYTPTTSDEDGVGYFDLVVKIYFKGVVPQFPDGGVMSQHLESLSIGDTIEIKGPLGHIEYLGRGKFLVSGEEKQGKKLAMLAGGTGITPIYQVAKAILADPEDKTEMWVLFGNRSVADVLLQDEMDQWVEQYPGRFHVWYTVCEPVPEDWKYGVGFVTAAMANERLPRGEEDSLALMCGPPPMIRAMTPLLEGMGYSSDRMLTF